MLRPDAYRESKVKVSARTAAAGEEFRSTVLGPAPRQTELVRSFGEGRIAFLRTSGSIDYHESANVVENDRVAHMFFAFTPGNAFK